MGVYVFLMFYPLILGWVFSKGSKQNNKLITWLFFIPLLLIFVLRTFSVGCDISGYVEVYEQSAFENWFDSDWIYMEPGYVFLMKLSNSLGLTFRGFMLFAYVVYLIPLGIYLFRESKDISLSLIIYVCFQFFVFNMSGFRQTLAMGLCMWAFMVAHKNGYKAFIKYLLIMLVAISIHRSSIVFVPAYFIMRQRLTPKMIILYLGIAVIAILSRDNILLYFQENEFTTHQFEENLTVGSSFIFTLAVVVLALSTNKGGIDETSFLNLKQNVFGSPNEITLGISNYANLLSCSILLMLAFSGSVLMRAATIYQISLLIVLPNMLMNLSHGSRTILRGCTIILMFTIFYYTVLLPNQFEIVPYILSNDISFIK